MAFSAPATGGKAQTSIAFGTTTAYDSLQWNELTEDGVSVPDVDTTHLGTTGGRTYIPGDVYEGGTYSFSCNADCDAPVLTGSVTETVTITKPITDGTNRTAGTVAFSGYVNNVSTTYITDTLVQHTGTIKVAGSITHTASSA